MEVYVARQPIFNRSMNIYEYELLYRKSMNNFFEGADDNKATAELINNSFLAMHFNELTSGTKAFINFSQDMLIKEIPLLLSSDSIVVEVLERVEVNEDIISACKKLREKGYIIALDDFVFNESYIPLIEIAHIIKIEFTNVDYDTQRNLIKKYKKKVKFLAEKIETREQYKMAMDMGYDYFQGYFFSKPVIIKGKEIENLNSSLVRILDLLNRHDPDYGEISKIIETDIGLSYKLLKVANSLFYGTLGEISNIKQALVRMGIIEIRKWIYVFMMKDAKTVENKELIKTCFIRAKFMEQIAKEIGRINKQYDYFMTGIFSSIDVLLYRDMESILSSLCLSDEVKEALLGKDNEIKKALDMVESYELFESKDIDSNSIDLGIPGEKIVNMYIEALKWVIKLDY